MNESERVMQYIFSISLILALVTSASIEKYRVRKEYDSFYKKCESVYND